MWNSDWDVVYLYITLRYFFSQAEGLKLTISRGNSGGRGRKPKRSRLDLEVDRIARLRDGGESECSQSTTARGTPDSFINGRFSQSASLTGVRVNAFNHSHGSC